MLVEEKNAGGGKGEAGLQFKKSAGGLENKEGGAEQEEHGESPGGPDGGSEELKNRGAQIKAERRLDKGEIAIGDFAEPGPPGGVKVGPLVVVHQIPGKIKKAQDQGGAPEKENPPGCSARPPRHDFSLIVDGADSSQIRGEKPAVGASSRSRRAIRQRDDRRLTKRKSALMIEI
jgi:hypothetical protein